MRKKRVRLVRAKPTNLKELYGESYVAFVFPCGAVKTVDFSRGPKHQRLSPLGVRIMRRTWENFGRVMPCPKHGRYAADCKKRGRGER